MAEAQVLYERRGAVAVITLNRPASLNALSMQMWGRWAELIQQANQDEEVGAIVVTGSGRAFCVGGDMDEVFLPKLRGEIPYDDDDHRLGGLGLPMDWISMARDSKPLIAAVNGHAVGGGVTSILPFDVIVAAEQASFSFMFVKLGIVPEMGSSKYLPMRVGFTRASEILLSGRSVDAAEALQIGLVNRVVTAEELLPAAMEMAENIAANPPSMLRLTKGLLDENSHEEDTVMLWRRESDALRECFSLPEHREAVSAVIEKRKPDFAAVRAASSHKDWALTGRSENDTQNAF